VGQPTNTPNSIFVQHASAKNTTITSVDIFNATHLTTIDKSAFFHMTNLANVILPEGLKTIGASVFSHTGITSIILPSSVTTIEKDVFKKCADLASVTLSEGLETIGQVRRPSCGIIYGRCSGIICHGGSRKCLSPYSRERGCTSQYDHCFQRRTRSKCQNSCAFE
jgi:hypothetical protein